MKVLSLICMFLFATTCCGQSSDDLLNIRKKLEELNAKAEQSRAELDLLKTKFGSNHPKLRQTENEFARIAEAKAELAARYAITQLQKANTELRSHADHFSEQVEKLQQMMSKKIDKKLKNEYEQIYSHSLNAIKLIQSALEKGQSESTKDLSRLLKDAKIDPEKTYESYRRTLESSLDAALKNKINAAEYEKLMAQRAQAAMAAELEVLKKRREQQNAIAKKNSQIAGQAKKKAEEALKATAWLWGTSSLEKQRMEQALQAAKAARASSDALKRANAKSTKEKVDFWKKSGEKKSKSIEDRLGKFESELAEIKQLMKQLLKKNN